MRNTTGNRAANKAPHLERCPYCGSLNVIAGPFEMYCLDCDESWTNESFFSFEDEQE